MGAVVMASIILMVAYGGSLMDGILSKLNSVFGPTGVVFDTDIAKKIFIPAFVGAIVYGVWDNR